MADHAARYPVVGIWDRISDPNDIDGFIAIEGLTNARVRDEASTTVWIGI